MAMLPAYGAGHEFRARFRSPSIRAIPPAGCTAHAEDGRRRQRRPQMDGLLAFSNELAAAVEHAGRATVGVNARRRFGSTGIHWRSGLIVTADHTVEVDEDVTVTTPDGRTLAATVAGRDPAIDVAILRVEAVPTSGRARHFQLAIPAATVTRVLDELGRRGRIPRAYLGVGTQSVRLAEALRQRLGTDQRAAVIIVDVQSDSPASAAGLVIGDVIV